MLDRCNRCRTGAPEFDGTLFEEGKVYHRYVCLCGNEEKRYVNPYGYDLDDPRAVKTMRLTRDYAIRMGLTDKGMGWRPANG